MILACVILYYAFVLTRHMMKIQQLAENYTEGAGISNLQTAAQTPTGQSCE